MKENNGDYDDWLLFGAVFITPVIVIFIAICLKILIAFGIMSGHWIIGG